MKARRLSRSDADDGPAAQKTKADAPRCTLESVATLNDLVRLDSQTKHLWKGWIQEAVVHALGAEGGTGKTRLLADLIRRIRHGLPWPDGQPSQ